MLVHTAVAVTFAAHLLAWNSAGGGVTIMRSTQVTTNYEHNT
jgi:hypothetical protein